MIALDVTKIFRGQNRPRAPCMQRALAKIFGDTTLTRDLFVVANLLVTIVG